MMKIIYVDAAGLSLELSIMKTLLAFFFLQLLANYFFISLYKVYLMYPVSITNTNELINKLTTYTKSKLNKTKCNKKKYHKPSLSLTYNPSNKQLPIHLFPHTPPINQPIPNLTTCTNKRIPSHIHSVLNTIV